MSSGSPNTDPTVLADCVMRCRPADELLVVEGQQRIEGHPITRIVRCRACGLAYEDPRPSREQIDAFYADERLWTESTDAEGNRRSYVAELDQKLPAFADLARRIERFETGGRLLDVGSGPGLLERALDSQRWDVLGVEMADHAVQVGRSELGASLIHGRFEDVHLPASGFDVVVMKYVLDHLEEPRGALQRARELLRPGGLLVVADLINIESFAARVFREGYRLLHPLHFTYFSSRTIRLHLGEVGFEVATIDQPFFNTPYFGPSALPRLAWRSARAVLNRALGRPQGVVSPAWRGNMIDVFAIAR